MQTPGPWIVGPVNRGPVAGTIPVTTPDYMESYRTGQLVCSVYGTAAFSERNARLIAAAPNLLLTLKQMLREHDALQMANGSTEDRWPCATEARRLIDRLTD